jgi:hypothetical protein
MTTLGDFYRLPEPWVRFTCNEDISPRSGFFTFGEGAIGFGRCSSISPVASCERTLPDALVYADAQKDLVSLPFDLDEIVRNLRHEEYMSAQTQSFTGRLARNAYYYLRPILSVRIRKYLQRAYLAGWRDISFPRWPVDRSVDRIMERTLALGIKASGADSVPFIWFWPEGYQSSAIITHDVETSVGRDFCSTLMDLDDSCCMKSAFQVIPEHRYEVPASFLASIRDRGFELNVHDLNHDGRLFSDENTFFQRATAINEYGKQFGARGFRAGIMYRNQKWLHALDFEYDMSVPTVAHLEPQRGGCCTTMPYFVDKVLELPLTTTQDYALFNILGERNIEIWEREIEAIHCNHGLITILVHPDYIIEKWAQDLYLKLLRHIANRAASDRIWLTTPGEVNDWWRYRSKLSLKQEGENWHVLGDSEHRSRIAYASLDGDSVRYSFEPPNHKYPHDSIPHSVLVPDKQPRAQ